MADTASAVQAVLAEEAVRLISVRGDLMRRDAEVSGMTWYGDQLVLLPQHPRRFSTCGGDGCLFTLTRADIERVLDSDEAGALEADGITFVASGVEEQLPGFEGYEAISLHDDRAFLVIEARTTEGMRGYVVEGAMSEGGRQLRLEAETLTELPQQVDLDNMSYESLTWHRGRLLVMHEANGANVNPYPKVYAFDERLQRAGTLRFPTVEYRVTDATEPDGRDWFWVINYFYPGEEELLNPAYDSVRARYGQGSTHDHAKTVERLVPLHVTESAIEHADHPPILLRLTEGTSRNWEGIAVLPGRGFLLVTDTYPETMLAFVPYADAAGPSS